MNQAPGARHGFVVPPLAGPVTGGTLYNRELCAALVDARLPIEVCSVGDAGLAVLLGAASSLWVDSLYLAELPGLKRSAAGQVGLITHYLPSFVALGRAAHGSELSLEERRALDAADSFLVTSPFMAEALRSLVASQKSILVVSPGTHARPMPRAKRAALGLDAVLIGNVVPGKRVEPLLRALADVLRPEDSLRLSIVGSLDADRAYAERCRRLSADSEALALRVTWCEACTPERTWSILGESDLLLSASSMESYGMALAEARVIGVPILSCVGGNAAAHVVPEAGGQLVSSVSQLGAACVELARAPAHARQRLEQARREALPARSWPRVAQEFVSQLACLE